VRKYLTRKVIMYLVTFFFAVTLNWALTRIIPGNPVQDLVSRFSSLQADARQQTIDYYNNVFGLNKSVFEQYVNYWGSLFKGDLGVSITMFPRPVASIIGDAAVYSLILLVPTVLLMFYFGNKLGAISGVNRKVEKFAMPVFYVLTSTPQYWFGVLLVLLFAFAIPILPAASAYSVTLLPSFSITFILDYMVHMILPFLSLFLIGLGGQAIGMRNMIIYEMGSNYSKYMECLGASKKLIRKYAYRNGLLPQVSGLAIAIAGTLGGQIVLENIFNYPGIGNIIYKSITNKDYFLMQGCFLFIVVAMLIANFVVDIVYMVLDPQVRRTFAGES
jgi:peptide/nickel transport system permease protein